MELLNPKTRERLRLRAVQQDKARCYRTVSRGAPASVFFLEAGYASVTVPLKDGGFVCAGILSDRLLIGASALTRTPSNHSYELTTLSTGHIYACSLEDAQREFNRGEEFQQLVLESLSAEIVQAVQLSACNALHDVTQRLSRWLLLCDDAVQGADIYITHEMLAGALGISRSTATMAVDVLQRDRILEGARGRVRILDRAMLEARTCECYFAIWNRYPVRHSDGVLIRPLGVEVSSPRPARSLHVVPLQTGA